MAQVFYASDADPAMQRAKEQARATFRYFWRELSWEYRRIVPGLDLSAVKVAFRDPEGTPNANGAPSTEEMWLGEIDFDGKTISGTLMNAPNWLRSIRRGDRAEVMLAGISDWMYSQRGKVCGAYTVNQMRAHMPPQERAEHDEAWGLDFGDPHAPRLLPPDYPPPPAEHPMALNMGPSLSDALRKNGPAMLAPDERGFTLLHQLSLAGTATGVSILLAGGADRTLRTKHGMTPLDLAQVLGWDDVARVLSA